MKRTALGLIAVLWLVGHFPKAAEAGDSCPPPCTKPPGNTRSVGYSLVLLADGVPAPVPGMVATLKKGKRSRVLVVEATMNTGVSAPNKPVLLNMYPVANGELMEPDRGLLLGSVGLLADCGASPSVAPPAGVLAHGHLVARPRRGRGGVARIVRRSPTHRDASWCGRRADRWHVGGCDYDDPTQEEMRDTTMMCRRTALLASHGSCTPG